MKSRAVSSDVRLGRFQAFGLRETQIRPDPPPFVPEQVDLTCIDRDRAGNDRVGGSMETEAA